MLGLPEAKAAQNVREKKRGQSFQVGKHDIKSGNALFMLNRQIMSQSGFCSTGGSVLIVDDNIFNVTTLQTLIKTKFKIEDSKAELDGKLALDRVKQTL